MLFSAADGHKIVSTATAETVGRLDQLVIDPAQKKVVALSVKKAQHGNTLPWPAITAFGADAVTVPGAESIGAVGEFEPLTGKANHVLGKRVLTTRGDEIGQVADVDFDPESGTVLAFVLGEGFVEGAKLAGIGSYAVVVHLG